MKNEKYAICTISSNNYLPYGLVCLYSAKKFNVKCDLFYLIADNYIKDLYVGYNEVNFINLNDIGINENELIKLKFKYNITEFNTSVKPAFIQYILLKKYAKVIYLDPDTQTYSNFNDIFYDLNKNDILLTPHKLSIKESNIIEDRQFLNNGIYNLGFIAVSNTDNTSNFLHWWQSKLNNECYIDYKHGLATDQIWVELVPLLFKKCRVLFDMGLNVAFWNINERLVTRKRNIYYVNNNTKLKFFHFSSFPIKCNNDLYNKVITYCPEFKYLYNNHIDEVKKYYINDIEKNEYGFLRFNNGKKIPYYLRYIYGNVELLNNKFSNPFDTGKGSFYYYCFRKRFVIKKSDSSSVSKITKILINIFGLNHIAKIYYYLSKISLIIIKRTFEIK